MESSKKELKLVRSLHQKKFRDEHDLFIAEGRKIVEEACRASCTVVSIYTTDPNFLTDRPGVVLISTREMEQISTLRSPPGYLAVIRRPAVPDPAHWSGDILVLDGIHDPGNMGTILRTADWFGIRTIICSPDCVEIFNPKVVQSTMGSLFRVVVFPADLATLLKSLKENGYTVFGAGMAGISPFQVEWPEKAALIIGSESQGIRPELHPLVEKWVHIQGAGEAESLNASVATGIILSGIFRQRVQ